MPDDLIDLLIKDHDGIRELFKRLEDPHMLPERSWEMANVAMAELVRHAVAEEAYLYPTARKALPQGRVLIDKEIEDHHRVDEIMMRLEATPVEETAFFQIMTELIDEVRDHVEQEETVLFPQLRLACEPDELIRLGRRAQTLEKIGPTRPHPRAPDTPPWNVVLAPGEGLVDRLRDRFEKRPHDMDELTPEPDLESIRRQRRS